MLSRALRVFVAFAAAFAVWAVATPAWAEAPMCDPRGATIAAPAPQLQEPETSIDVAVAADDECSELAATPTSLDDGRGPEPAPPRVSQEPTVAGAPPVVHAANVEESFTRDGVTGSERAGARSRVDRPPRG